MCCVRLNNPLGSLCCFVGEYFPGFFIDFAKRSHLQTTTMSIYIRPFLESENDTCVTEMSGTSDSIVTYRIQIIQYVEYIYSLYFTLYIFFQVFHPKKHSYLLQLLIKSAHTKKLFISFYPFQNVWIMKIWSSVPLPTPGDAEANRPDYAQHCSGSARGPCRDADVFGNDGGIDKCIIMDFLRIPSNSWQLLLWLFLSRGPARWI